MNKPKIKISIPRDPWAVAKVGDPCVLQTFKTKPDAERHKGNRRDLEVREVIG